MRQRRQPCLVERRQQHSARDPHAFGDVVVLRGAILRDPALALREAHDQPRRGFEEGLVRVRAQRGECIELGLDKFDEAVNKFLEKFSRKQIISVHSLNYSHFDPTTQKYLPDYAALIVYER